MKWLSLFLLALTCNGANVDMYGSFSFVRSGSSVTLQVEYVENYDSAFSVSGTLALQLWATTSPFGGGTLTGYKLAETSLGTLQGSYFLHNISRTVSFTEPPAGTYNIVFVIAEWNGLSFVTDDWANFAQRQTFGSQPVIISNPSSRTIFVGDSATFSVSVTGSLPLFYQWRKGGADIPGATSSSFTVGTAQVSDAGRYSVYVFNGVGTALSSSATLSVQQRVSAPTITSQPQSLTVTVGQQASFFVSIAGTAPFDYQWDKNGGAISGATSSTLTLSSAALADTGHNRVRVSNPAGQVFSDPATLTVSSGNDDFSFKFTSEKLWDFSGEYHVVDSVSDRTHRLLHSPSGVISEGMMRHTPTTWLDLWVTARSTGESLPRRRESSCATKKS